MSDYISREAAIEAMYEVCNKDQRQIFTREQLLALDDVPAADVRENKRGHIEEDENTYLWCSECGCNITLSAYTMPNGNLILRPNFCPNCGADMRTD